MKFKPTLLLLILILLGVSYCTVKNGYVLEDSYPPDPIEENPGPYQGVGAYIINLDRSKERYAYVKPYVDGLHLPTERISAIDGREMSDAYMNHHANLAFFREFYHNPTKGAIGCYLSHVKTWQF